MRLVGHKIESIYRRYAITDEAIVQETGAKLSVLHKSLFVKVALKSDGLEAPNQFSEATHMKAGMEAASGLEPGEQRFCRPGRGSGLTDARRHQPKRPGTYAA
jgi:hypothetical protein